MSIPSVRGSSSSRATRKSVGLKKSQTQKFFDSEKDINIIQHSSSCRNIASSTSSLASALSATTLNGSTGAVDPEDGELSEREAKRKEIRSLIMKYAQLDDVYGRSTMVDDENNNSTSGSTTANNKSSLNKLASNKINDSYYETAAGRPSLMMGSDKGSVYGSSTTGSSKYYGRDAQRQFNSRIPKALSAFVRLSMIIYLFVILIVLFDFTTYGTQNTHFSVFSNKF